MTDSLDVELRIVVAEGVVPRSEVDALAEEARRKNQSLFALLVEQRRLSEDSRQSLVAAAMKDPKYRDRAGGVDASGSTYTMSPQPPSTEAPAFPVPGWDRYINPRFLGQGGMGKVFLAVDTRLRREVAIKFVRGDDAEHVRRLIAEARTQARVRDERICDVYEVGEVEGKVYIAMQYIAGKPLGSIAGELTLEQKVMLVRGAAEGLHEAHRVGIIHRDIKPSNIMVERTDDGEIRPYVMDFGLARSAHEAGATLTGTVLGTPRYMSPEQAHGDAVKPDRRADIYSLGATLYHLLTGEPPVPGETVGQVIANLITLEPRPLRAIDPTIPIDLEAIVLKCLEKDRSARYVSARALADDLGRFMNGEAVHARPADAWYRLRKRIARQRRLFIAGAAAAVLLLVAIGWGVWSRMQATERERLARRFTEQVENIEASARYSAQAPLHALDRDRTALRKKMGSLRAEIDEAGPVAQGAGRYALGRGHLALDDDAAAYEELMLAWHLEFREPRAEYALAQVLGHLYQQGLVKAERIENPQQREVKKRGLEKQYRDPARDLLNAIQRQASQLDANQLEASSLADLPSMSYVDALAAYYTGELEAALHKLDVIDQDGPWFYEIPQLRGDIRLARGLTLRNQGKRDQARADFDAGRKAYTDATEIGRSAPAVYKSLGELEYAGMAMQIYGEGNVMPLARRALEATGNALKAVPDHYDALVLQAGIQRVLAEREGVQSNNVDALLTSALADAAHAMVLAPGRSEARLEMARIYGQWASTRRNRHEDPGDYFGKAIAISGDINMDDRDASYYASAGYTFLVWADYQDSVGQDSEMNRTKSIDVLHKALDIDNTLVNAWINLGHNLYKRAVQPHAKDPDRDLQHAIDALEKARAINPEHTAMYLYEGSAYSTIAQRKYLRGEDPGPDLGRAQDIYKLAIAIDPTLPYFRNGLGITLMNQAKAAWDHGNAPDPLLEQAIAAFQQATEVAPKHPLGYGNVGEMFALRAWFQRARSEDPTSSVDAAVKWLKRAIDLTPNESSFWADLAMAHAVLGAHQLALGLDPQPNLKMASEAVDKALASNARDAQAHLYQGETLGIQARYDAGRGHGSADAFEKAAQAFQQAINLDPENQDYQIAFGHFCGAWATFQHEIKLDPGATLKRGLAFAERLVAARPSWPDALVLRGSLSLVQAQISATDSERRTSATKAAQDLDQAIVGNPALHKIWQSQLAIAQKLAPP